MRRLIVLFSCAALAAWWTGSAAAANDPGLPKQWAMAKVGAEQAWAASTGTGVTIAVVDSGADLTHEDLKANLAAGRSFVQGLSSAQDDDGHGTHVSGIAAAVANNGRGIAGVAPGARIMPVKVLKKECDSNGNNCQTTGNNSDVSAGMRWAADNGARVINLSLGDTVTIRQVVLGSSVEDAIDYAWSKGALPVVAAGNGGSLFPSGYSALNGIVVAATDRNDARTSYSQSVSDAKYGMAAPGGVPSDGGGCESTAIVSTWAGGGYACAAGTSMAAPHVAGAAAVLLAAGLTRDATVQRLLSSADKGAASLGAGRLNVARAAEGLGPAAGGGSSGGAPSGGSGGRGSSSGSASSARAPARRAAAGTGASPAPEAAAEPTAEPDRSPDELAPTPAPSVVAFGSVRPKAGAPSRALPLAAGIAAVGAGAGGAWGLHRMLRRR